eukprot:TRINITY_DN27731_c0_g1_i1.p1 TRINITY_DN27731_c0_g1~~TRINITY_DN27731_c0_g1_i1.p1  ORF type:complete len:318 (+),score=130.15 TRINITY_DN27731_c0_g1_i1:50-1003(+)
MDLPGHDHEHEHDAYADSGDVLRFKIFSLLAIAATGMIGGLLPLRLRVSARLLSFGNVLSGGVFLAAGFTHMLSEAVEGFGRLDVSWLGKLAGPLPYFLCMLGLLLTFFVERVVQQHRHGHNPLDHVGHAHHASHAPALEQQASDESRGIRKDSEQLNVWMLSVLLSVHSLIEGVALGIEDTVADTSNVFIAIVSHKAFAAFALGVSLAKHNASANVMFRFVAAFSLMTPAGIVLGVTASALQDSSNSIAAEAIKAVSAGTFIYIALVEVIIEEFDSAVSASRRDKILKFIVLLLGATLMCISSIHGHDHGGHVHTR